MSENKFNNSVELILPDQRLDEIGDYNRIIKRTPQESLKDINEYLKEEYEHKPNKTLIIFSHQGLLELLLSRNTQTNHSRIGNADIIHCKYNIESFNLIKHMRCNI